MHLFYNIYLEYVTSSLTTWAYNIYIACSIKATMNLEAAKGYRILAKYPTQAY